MNTLGRILTRFGALSLTLGGLFVGIWVLCMPICVHILNNQPTAEEQTIASLFIVIAAAAALVVPTLSALLIGGGMMMRLGARQPKPEGNRIEPRPAPAIPVAER